MLISYLLSKPQSSGLVLVAETLRDSTEAFERAAESIAALTRQMRRYAALHGSGRTRKPYIKQPGVQFGVFAEGRLTQYKRLADGSVVKV